MRRHPLYIAILAAALTACTESPLAPLDTADSDVMIVPTASIELPGRTRADFSGPVNGTSFTPSTDKIFGVTAYIDEHVPTSWIPTSRINSEPVHSDEIGNYFFDENKFYPREGSLYFYAFSPMVNCTYQSGTETAHPTVTYRITGREDILWAKNESGIGQESGTTQGQPDFQFHHKLQRVIFSVRRGESVPSTAKITEIRISGLRTEAVLDIITGELTFDQSQDLSPLSVVYDFNPSTTYATVPYGLMFEAGPKEFDLTVVMNDTEFTSHVVMADEHAGEAGYKHEVRITMTGESLVLDVPQIVDWESFETDGTI